MKNIKRVFLFKIEKEAYISIIMRKLHITLYS